jgi:hypothetical protein
MRYRWEGDGITPSVLLRRVRVIFLRHLVRRRRSTQRTTTNWRRRWRDGGRGKDQEIFLFLRVADPFCVTAGVCGAYGSPDA